MIRLIEVSLALAALTLLPTLAAAEDGSCDSTMTPCSDGYRFTLERWYTHEFPLEEAIRVFPTERADGSNLDLSLDRYLSLDACILGRGCDTFGTNAYGRPLIRFSGRAYQVYWRPHAPSGAEYQIDIYVAGLLVGSYSGYLQTGGAVPIRFNVYNHPQIRARVLVEEGARPFWVAWVLADEFGIGPEEASALLVDEGFNQVEVAQALYDVYRIHAANAAWILARRGFSAMEIARALFLVYEVTDTKAMARHLTCPSFPNEDDIFVGFFTPESIYDALKAVLDADFQSGACALHFAGFSGATALEVTYDDLVAFYTPIIDEIGIELRMHSDEPYPPTTLEWYTTHTRIQDNWCSGSCVHPTPNQMFDVTDATRSCMEESGSSDWAACFEAACEWEGLTYEPPDDGCEAEDDAQQFRLLPDGEFPRRTSPDAPDGVHYVHIVRGDEWTDVQFWTFYDYNGFGYLQITASICLGGVCPIDHAPPPSALPPVGEHDSDFEVEVLRLSRSAELEVLRGETSLAAVLGDARAGESDFLEGMTTSAHGEFFPGDFPYAMDEELFTPSVLGEPTEWYELEWSDDGHVVAYSALNGHGAFAHVGSNVVEPYADAEDSVDLSFGVHIPGGRLFPYPCPTWDKPWKVCWVKIDPIDFEVPLPTLSVAFSAYSPNTTADGGDTVRAYDIVGAYDTRLGTDHIEDDHRWARYLGTYATGGRFDFDESDPCICEEWSTDPVEAICLRWNTPGCALTNALATQVPLFTTVACGTDLGWNLLIDQLCPALADEVKDLVESWDVPFASDVLAAALGALRDACRVVSNTWETACGAAVGSALGSTFELYHFFADSFDTPDFGLTDILELIDSGLIGRASVSAIGGRVCEPDRGQDKAQWYYPEFPNDKCVTCERDCAAAKRECVDAGTPVDICNDEKAECEAMCETCALVCAEEREECSEEDSDCVTLQEECGCPPLTCLELCRRDGASEGECLRRCFEGTATCEGTCLSDLADCVDTEPGSCETTYSQCQAVCCEDDCIDSGASGAALAACVDACHSALESACVVLDCSVCEPNYDACIDAGYDPDTCEADRVACLADCWPCVAGADAALESCDEDGPDPVVCDESPELDCLAEANEALSSCMLAAVDCADTCFPDCMADCLGLCQDVVACDADCRLECGLPACCDDSCEEGCACCDDACGADCDG